MFEIISNGFITMRRSRQDSRVKTHGWQAGVGRSSSLIRVTAARIAACAKADCDEHWEPAPTRPEVFLTGTDHTRARALAEHTYAPATNGYAGALHARGPGPSETFWSILRESRNFRAVRFCARAVGASKTSTLDFAAALESQFAADLRAPALGGHRTLQLAAGSSPGLGFRTLTPGKGTLSGKFDHAPVALAGWRPWTVQTTNRPMPEHSDCLLCLRPGLAENWVVVVTVAGDNKFVLALLERRCNGPGNTDYLTKMPGADLKEEACSDAVADR